MDQIRHLLPTKTSTEFRLFPSSNAVKNCHVTNRSPYIGSSTTLTASSSNAHSVCILTICHNSNRRIYGSKIEPTDYTQEFRKRSSADETADLLECTTWTGAGPGLMDALTKGALQAEKPVGGLKIAQEAGEWTSSNFHPYLPSETYLTCRFFSARKHGLVDAAMRNDLADHTAIVGLPGGIGTLDEIFEILTLVQLERIGSMYPVPFILMNYDGFYSKLLDFFGTCKQWGTVSDGEVDALWKVCECNSEALEYLADFYNIHEDRRKFRGRLQEAYAPGG